MQTIIDITTNLIFLTIFYNTSAYFCFNQTLVKFSNFKYENVQRLCTYIYSSFHSYLIIIGSYLFLINKITLETYFKFTIFTASYALFDIIILILNKTLKKEFLLHHTLLFISTIITFPNENLYPYLAYGLLGELSSLFLNKTWFNLHTIPINKKQTMKNTIITIILFTIFRIINYLNLLKVAFENEYYIGFILTLIVYILNIYWYILLIKKAISINKKLD